MSIESVMPSNHLILCRPLLRLPSDLPSIRFFPSETGLHITWPKYWRFSFSISPSNEYSGLISFQMDWLDLLSCLRDSQESSPTPQFKNISSLVFCLLYCPALTSVRDYWKDHSLTTQTSVSKVISLLFNILCRFVIAYLPRSKHLLIS